jgi:hypothetical protein
LFRFVFKFETNPLGHPTQKKSGFPARFFSNPISNNRTCGRIYRIKKIFYPVYPVAGPVNVLEKIGFKKAMGGCSSFKG